MAIAGEDQELSLALLLINFQQPACPSNTQLEQDYKSKCLPACPPRAKITDHDASLSVFSYGPFLFLPSLFWLGFPLRHPLLPSFALSGLSPAISSKILTHKIASCCSTCAHFFSWIVWSKRV